MPIRVLLVDDHPIFREGLIALLASRRQFEVVGEASNGQEAVERARALKPDLVLMDIRMPGSGGLEATRNIKQELPQTRVGMLTVSEEEEDLFEAVKSGAQGYILKNLPSADVLDLLVAAAHGEVALTRGLASRLFQELGRQTGHPGPQGLSDRECAVLELVAEGLSNQEIAHRLGLSEATVRFHLRNVLSKLHLKNRTQAAIHAVRHGLVRPPP